MKRCVTSYTLLILLAGSTLAWAQREQDKVLATTPEVQTAQWAQAWWMPRHEQKLKEKADLGRVDLLMIGDSITHGWEGKGREDLGSFLRQTPRTEYRFQRRPHRKRAVEITAWRGGWHCSETGRDHDRHQQYRPPPG